MALLTPESAEYSYTVASIAQAAKIGYQELPYHNWDHAQAVTVESRRLVGICAVKGMELDQFVTDASSLLHDYNYAMPLRPEVFRSRELRSSRAAGVILRLHHIDPSQIRHVQSCIRSTEVGVPCRSDEAKVVRRADLMNIAGDYSAFILNTWRLFQETKQLTGSIVPLKEWLKTSRRVLANYVEEDVRLDFEKQESAVCQFTVSALKNIWRLGHESETEFLEKLTD